MKLGKKTKYTYGPPSRTLLERFPSPFKDTVAVLATVHIEAPEFTSLCPITGQPDFATIVIDYRPREYCVESKSLKLYLGTFRQHGEFHEACIKRIGEDLCKLLYPHSLIVEGQFSPRGGIKFWPKWDWTAGP